MDLEELAVRLNDKEYKNWLKASRCLLLLKDGLHLFITPHMRAFHENLLHRNPPLRTPCETPCRPSGTTFSPCRACSGWRTVILSHHRQRETATVNWGNCFPPLWRTDSWELAKAYMPRGQRNVTGADRCDASALLNLINCCDCFQSVDLRCVREVIHYRNNLMHSDEMRVEDGWMELYRTALKKLVRQFSDVPRMAAIGRQMEAMLKVDLSIHVYALDRIDSSELDDIEHDSSSQWEISADLISQWEAELLQMRLQELLHAAAAAAADEDSDDDSKAQCNERLKRLGGFLQANRDLAERFSAELQAIKSLEASR